MNDELKTKEYFKSMEQIKLADSSRARIKSDLLAYARFHAAPEVVAASAPIRSPFFGWVFKPVPAALVLVLLVGTTTSLLAKGSAPGDFLYALKTGVNESFRGVFAIGTKSNTEFLGEPSQVQLADATTPQADIETSDAEHGKNNEIHKNAKVDGTLAMNARSHISLESPATEDTAFVADVSDLTTMLSKGTVSIDAYTADMKLRDKTLRDLVKKYDTQLESKVKTDFTTKLDAAGVLVGAAGGKSEADARERLDSAALLIGEVEAKLSTLGQVIVKDGIIVDIDFSVDVTAPQAEDEDDSKDNVDVDAPIDGAFDTTSSVGL